MSEIYIDPDNHLNSNHFAGVKVRYNNNIVDAIEAHFPLGYHFTTKEAKDKIEKAKYREVLRLPDNQKKLSRELFSLLNIICKYKKNTGRPFTKYGEKEATFPFVEYLTIIEDFIHNGYYVENDVKYKHASLGKINWKRTIAQVRPIIQDESPIYTDFIVRINEKRKDKIITQIHELCVYEAFLRFGWVYTSFIPDIPVLKSINETNDKEIEYYVSIIAEALKSTFNDRLKLLFQSMIAILNGRPNIGESEKTFQFGTNDFEDVWEKMIEVAYDTDKEQEYNPPAHWNYFNGTKYFASKLKPDSIMILPGKKEVFVLDAKYYNIKNVGSIYKDEETKSNPLHLPAASDINKQIRYGAFAAGKNADSKTYNAYMFPYDLYELISIKKDEKYKGKFFYLGYAEIKAKNTNEPYEKVLGILVDTKWLMENYGNADKEELAKFVKRQYKKTNVKVIGKINLEHFHFKGTISVLTKNVIMTEKQIEHIKERHPDDYERYFEYIPQVLSKPDYILEANKPHSVIMLKQFEVDGKRFQLVLRLKAAIDPEEYENSIITFFKIRKKEWNRLINRKTILYKTK